MASLTELRAANMLAIGLETQSLLLVSGLLSAFSGKSISQRSIEEGLHSRISSSIGQLWGPTVNFLRESTATRKDEKLKMVEIRWPELYERNRAISDKILKLQSLQPLTEAGSILNDLVTSQVDDTQKMIGFQKGLKWRRHVDAKACQWCRDQVANYRDTGAWFRHANCKCFKVREG